MAKKESASLKPTNMPLQMPIAVGLLSATSAGVISPLDTKHLSTEKEFAKTLTSDGSAVTEVATDPRVFERITLGLYREPASAIRELISNAYDADAEKVTVSMNPPYFDKIVVSDDGNGMSSLVIDHLVHHVGGSLKKSPKGKTSGVTKSVGVSPRGRKLIGQMGIGIYSVARLTRRFTIETKERKSPFKFLVDIDLQGLDPENLPVGDADRYVAGYARVERMRAHPAEIDNCGTTITLHDVVDEARRLLQSTDRWENYFAKVGLQKKGELKFHIGRVAEPTRESSLPWGSGDQPLVKFKKLVDALSTPSESSEASPSIDQTLDYYLAMLWKISLSAPLRYLERHPFSMTTEDGIDFYDMRGDATPDLIVPPDGVAIGTHLGIVEKGSSPSPFAVYIDGIELRRPIIFRPFDNNDGRLLLKRPKLFIGDFRSEREGAALSLTGYYYWSYDLIPKESNGMLVRIAGASGTLFDHGFLGYRTSENIRLKQVSAEAFIESGLDDALNVDRESFVETDPSVRALQRWTERSMTRLFTRLKADQKAASAQKKDEVEFEEGRLAEEAAAEVWTRHRGRQSEPPKIVISSRQAAAPETPPNALFIGNIPSEKRGGIEKEQVFVARLRAVVRILDAWGLLGKLSEGERSSLVADLARVLKRK